MFSRRQSPGSSKKIRNKKEAIKTFLIGKGWELDRWGNLRKGERRIKFQPISIRYEVKTKYSGWVKLQGGFYNQLEIKNDVLVGLT